jgi:hypothetical protein
MIWRSHVARFPSNGSSLGTSSAIIGCVIRSEDMPKQHVIGRRQPKG